MNKSKILVWNNDTEWSLNAPPHLTREVSANSHIAEGHILVWEEPFGKVVVRVKRIIVAMEFRNWAGGETKELHGASAEVCCVRLENESA